MTFSALALYNSVNLRRKGSHFGFVTPQSQANRIFGQKYAFLWYIVCLCACLRRRECRSNICKWLKTRAKSPSSCQPKTTELFYWAHFRLNFPARPASNFAILKRKRFGGCDWARADCIRLLKSDGALRFSAACFRKVGCLEVIAVLPTRNFYDTSTVT